MLREIADSVWVNEQPLRFVGIPIGTRMTVVRLPDRSLLVHSPIRPTPEVRAALDAIGPVKHIVAPNRFHHLFAGHFANAYPDAWLFAAPGLPEKRRDLRFHHTLVEAAPAEWGDVLEPLLVGGIPLLREVAFVHKPSRTLIVSDLCFNYGADDGAGFAVRMYRKLEDCDGKFAVARIIKLAIWDRPALRASVERLLTRDFDRVVVAHGDVRAPGGQEAVRSAFGWLLS
jgi:hypothetical protein